MMLLNKAESLINAIKAKINITTKPGKKFYLHLLILYMGLRGKNNSINMARYGSYTEQTYRTPDFIFSKLSLDTSCEKYKCFYEECLVSGG